MKGVFMSKIQLMSDEYNPYYQPYIDEVSDLELLQVLEYNQDSLISFIKSIPEDKLHYRYADGKWTIKEIILHLIDTERVFAYRALCIARNDKSQLPGFDQDAFVVYSNANDRTIDSLLLEYQDVRKATLSLFATFDDKTLATKGTANNNVLSVRAAAFIIAGHEKHHLQIIKDRYL